MTEKVNSDGPAPEKLLEPEGKVQENENGEGVKKTSPAKSDSLKSDLFSAEGGDAAKGDAEKDDKGKGNQAKGLLEDSDTEEEQPNLNPSGSFDLGLSDKDLRQSMETEEPANGKTNVHDPLPTPGEHAEDADDGPDQPDGPGAGAAVRGRQKVAFVEGAVPRMPNRRDPFEAS